MRLGRLHLFVAFAFTVAADPISSVAYAIEAALGGLDADSGRLFLTMAMVVAVIAVVAGTYHQLIGRFPRGAGGPSSVAEAFGEGWTFVPLGALLVDFTLTVAVSCAAGAAALIAYVPGLADQRVPVALALAIAVAGLVLLGHRGRVGFALASQAFLLCALAVVIGGVFADPATTAAGVAQPAAPLVGDVTILPILLALPLGMALATGLEAPSDAIAQLPQLNDQERRRFGRLTLWLMVAIVGALTVSLAALAVHLRIGLPPSDSTMLAEIARRAVGDGGLFGAFQAASALLLLAAAASSYLAGSGVLKALALTEGVDEEGEKEGLLPRRFGRINSQLVPPWGVALVLGCALAMLIASGGHEQDLVQFYAVSVFASFFAATMACAKLSHRDGNRRALAVNLLGAALVAMVLGFDMTRLDPVLALLASGAVALYLWAIWVRRGRPAGIHTAISR